MVLTVLGAVMLAGVAVQGAFATQIRQATSPEEPVPLPGIEMPAAAKQPVEAEDLWSAALDALDCFESEGFATMGPVPSIDGIHVLYSVEDRPGFLAAERACAEDVISLQRRFAMDKSPEQARLLSQLRINIAECLVTRGVVVPELPDPPRELPMIPGPGRPTTAEGDTPLQVLADKEPEAVRGCAEQLRP